MLIHQPTQKLVLNLGDPARVTTVIPSAKEFDYKGRTMVAVPHRLDETRVLNNMGIEAPSPIKYHYSWSGPYTPFEAQRETAAFLTLNPKAFVLNDMGTGKTLATLWAFDYLRTVGKATKMLVASPLSTLEATWADEVFRHFPHLTVGVVHGSKERRAKILAGDFDIYLINHDGVKVMEAELCARPDIDVVVIDEVATFRNASTGRWKAMHRVTKTRPVVWGLTGTPTPNLPTDAWAQCRLISPERVPRYFGQFKDSVLKQIGPFKWVPRESATDIVANAMQPAIRYSRDQCVDLPPCIYQSRKVSLTSEQAKAYKDMVADLAMEFADAKALAVNEAVKMQKLLQIACGVVYGSGGEEIVLPNHPRMDVVREVIEEAGTKVIVFVPFKSVIRHVADELSKDYAVECVSGDTSKGDRDRIFRAFQDGGANGPKVLVAQPASMAHGLTLTAANTIVWYAPVTSHETYQQANARVTRPGQKHTQFVVNIECTDVERRIYQKLAGKEQMQGLLLDIIRG